MPSRLKQSEPEAHRRSDRDAPGAPLGAAIERVHQQQSKRRRMHRSPHHQVHARAPQQCAQRARVPVEHRDAHRIRARTGEVLALGVTRARDEHVPLGDGVLRNALDDLHADRLGERLHVGEFAVVDHQECAIRGVGTHVAPPEWA